MDNIPQVLGQLVSGECTVENLVISALDRVDLSASVEKWRTALQILGTGGSTEEREAQLRALAMYCCRHLVRCPAGKLEVGWTTKQLRRLGPMPLADACLLCVALLQLVSNQHEWKCGDAAGLEAVYAVSVIQEILRFVKEFVDAAALHATSVDADSAALHNEVLLAVAVAETRLGILAWLGPIIGVVSCISFVSYFRAPAEQLLCECVRYEQWDQCYSLLQALPVDSRTYRAFAYSEFRSQADKGPLELDLLLSLSPLDKQREGSRHANAGNSLALSLSLFDLAVCSEASCGASSTILVACVERLGRVAEEDAWLSDAATRMLVIARHLREFPRYCSTLGEAVSSCCGEMLSTGELIDVAELTRERQQYSSLRAELPVAAALASAIALEESHRTWCQRSAARLSDLLLRHAGGVVEMRPVVTAPAHFAEVQTRYVSSYFAYLLALHRHMAQRNRSRVSLASIANGDHGLPWQLMEKLLFEALEKGTIAETAAFVRKMGFSCAGIVLESKAWADIDPVLMLTRLRELGVAPVVAVVITITRAIQRKVGCRQMWEEAINVSRAVPSLNRWLCWREQYQQESLGEGSAREIIDAAESCGDIDAAVRAADTLLSSGAPDRLLLKLANSANDNDWSSHSLEQRIQLVQRIRDPEAAAELCLRWLKHFPGDVAENLLLACECKISSSQVGVGTGTQDVLLALRARRTEILTYQNVLTIDATRPRWSTWLSLHHECTTQQLQGVVEHLSQLQQFELAREILAQCERRSAREILAHDYSCYRWLLELTSKAELFSILSQPSMLYRAVLLLNQLAPLDACRICQDYILSGLADVGENAAEAPLVINGIVLHFARQCTAEALASMGLPSVQQLTARDLGLRALWLLPDAVQCQARGLVDQPNLLLENLLRSCELECAAGLLKALPQLADDALLSRFALFAADPRTDKAGLCLRSAVITAYFDTGNATNAPRVGELSPRGSLPWLTGDKKTDDTLRAALTAAEYPTSILLSERILMLCGDRKRVAIMAQRAAETLLETVTLGHSQCEPHVARKLLIAAQDLSDLCRLQLNDADEMDHTMRMCLKLQRDITILGELLDADIEILVTLDDLKDAQRCRQLCDRLIADDCVDLALRVSFLCSLDVAPVVLAWGLEALDSGQFRVANELLHLARVQDTQGDSAQGLAQVVGRLATQPMLGSSDSDSDSEGTFEFEGETFATAKSGTMSPRRMQIALDLLCRDGADPRDIISLLLSQDQFQLATQYCLHLAVAQELPITAFLPIVDWVCMHRTSLLDLSDEIALSQTRGSDPQKLLSASARSVLVSICYLLATRQHFEPAYALAVFCREDGCSALMAIGQFLVGVNHSTDDKELEQALNNAENHLLAITSDYDEYEATAVSIGGSTNETGSKTMTRAQIASHLDSVRLQRDLWLRCPFPVARTEPLLRLDKAVATRLASALLACGGWSYSRRIILEHGAMYAGGLAAAPIVKDALVQLVNASGPFLELELALDQLETELDHSMQQPCVDLPIREYNAILLDLVGILATPSQNRGGACKAMATALVTERIRPRGGNTPAALAAEAVRVLGFLKLENYRQAYTCALRSGRADLVRRIHDAAKDRDPAVVALAAKYISLL